MVYEGYPNHCQGCFSYQIAGGHTPVIPLPLPLGLQRTEERGEGAGQIQGLAKISLCLSSVSKSISVLLLRQVISGLRFAVEWLKLPAGS